MNGGRQAGPADAERRVDVATSYRGAVASEYLARRVDSLKWRLENEAVETLLEAIPADGTLLDAPVGTGRFLAAYARHSRRWIGLDVSLDMLAQARAAQASGGGGRLMQGLVAALPLRDGAVEHVLSTRLLNWFDRHALAAALREFKRVSRGLLLLEIRLSRPLGWRHLPGFAAELGRRPFASLRRLGRSVLPPAVDRPTLTIHPEREFRALLEELGLRVERCLSLDDGTACTRKPFRHTPLRFYVLSRRDP